MPFKDKEKQRACCRASYKKHGHMWKKQSPERRRHLQLLKLYGMTLTEFEHRRYLQGRSCAICKQEVNTLYVDHDHKTGKVRALLCRRCNLLLGLANDNWKLLWDAGIYLRAYGTA